MIRQLVQHDYLPDYHVAFEEEADMVVFTNRGTMPPALPLHHAIAVIAARRLGTDQPRPAPFYLRGADAAPPADPPPVILP